MNVLSLNLLSLLGFVLAAQWKHLFQFKNALSLLGRVLFLALILLYAVGFGLILQNAERFGMSVERVLHGLNAGIAILTFSKSYFPAYQPTSQPLLSFYPVSRINKALLGFLTDMLAVFPVAMLVLYAVVFGMAFSVLTAAQILMSLVIFASALVLDRSLRLVVEYAVPLRWLYGACTLGLVIVLVGGSALTSALQLPPTALDSSFLALLLLVVACAVQARLAWQSVLPSTERSASVSPSRMNAHTNTTEVGYILRAFFGSKHIAMMFGMAFLLKCGMMFFLYKVKGEEVAEISASMRLDIIMLYVAPTAWFTYVLNNSFGMNWQLWQTTQQHSRRGLAALTLYFRYTLLPLCADAALSSAMLWHRGLLTINIIAFWFWCTLSFLALGLIVSVLMPIKVEKMTSNMFVSLRQSSSTIGIAGAIFLLLTTYFLSQVHYLLGGIMAALVMIAAIYIVMNYHTLKYQTYDRIHH